MLGMGLAVLAGIGVRAVGRMSARIDSLVKEVSDLRAADPTPQVILREVVTERRTAEESAGSDPTHGLSSAGKLDDTAHADPEQGTEIRQQQIEAQVEARARAYQDAHAKEARDPEWAPWATQILQQAFRAEEFRSLQIVADCRTTMCRVDATYSDPSLNQIAGRALSEVRPWPGVGFSKLDPEGHAGYGIIVREGSKLPEADPSPSVANN